MPSRGRGAAQDWIAVLSRLPWWAGVVLAAVSYVLLHRLAQWPVAAPGVGAAADAWVGTVVATVFKAAATFGQFVVPLVCLIGAAASAAGRLHRRNLLDKARRDGLGAVRDLAWRDFERLVAQGFRQRGFVVQERGGSGADGGVDLVLVRERERYLVQCKQWRAFTVGVPVVRELYGAMAAHGAAGGYVVTAGDFTAPARAFAAGRNIELIDGARLAPLLAQARDAETAASPVRGDAAAVAPVAPGAGGVVETPPQAVPPACADPAATVAVCPRCGHPMALRVARRGDTAGSRFWGCTRYPACRGTRPLGPT